MNSFAVIPAAGQSVRMGQPKLLLPWGEGRVIDAVLAAWRGSQVSKTIVVVRDDDEQLIAACQQSGVHVVRAGTATPDMKATVRLGLEFVEKTFSPAAEDVWLLAPADIPRLSSRVIDQVLSAYRPESPRPVVPVHDGRRGHPALFPWPFVQRLKELADDEGIDSLLRAIEIVEVTCEDGTEIQDIDTPDDYRKML